MPDDAASDDGTWDRHVTLSGRVLRAVKAITATEQCSPWEMCLSLNVVSAQCLMACLDRVPDKTEELSAALLSHISVLVDDVKKAQEKKHGQ